MEFRIEYEREDDGRWLAEVPQLPGVLAYGSSANEAMARVEILALRVLAEQLEQGEAQPRPIHIAIAAA
ncbi:MAG TPA: type II toxin-antitoxin system HicB family antitoxin [Thermoanaerobaculia bacterium]|nr:type II toxin-antitoxin system HicB family antitoxin [Thermoanaerobaculia bacterium]